MRPNASTRGVRHRLRGIDVVDVDLHRDRRGTVGRDLGGGLDVVAQVCKHDFRAFAGETLGITQAEAACRAGDDDDMILEPHS